jgi:hypothetical protein
MLALSLALAAQVALPAPDSSRLQLSATGYFDFADFTSPVGAPINAHHVGGSGYFSIVVYPQRALVDDDAPLTLQPFLQRLTSVGFDASVGGSQNYGTGVVGSTFIEATASAFADVYVTRHLILDATFGFERLASSSVVINGVTAPGGSIYQLPITAGIGGRFADTRIDLAWTVTPTDPVVGSWTVPYWYGVDARVASVLLRHVEAQVDLRMINGGVAADAFAGIYPY